IETQINPHFLYNILESINWRAKAIGEKQISQMVESLGKLLRAALGKTDESFNLSKEIELVNSYMTIQQIRFEDQLHFQLDVPQSLLCASIPKLTIQPLVENAIHYSLEQNTEDCFIKIEVKLVDGDIIIDVKNTGSQFEDNLLEKLTQSQIKPHGFGIGLLNIHNRIQLTFGEAYGLEFFNENGNAVARVKIPFSPAV
ncbi:MAG TPA: sensor histidine kinase, partial [Ruminococcaceae bacterium]|nr:sensor histidine kinase [Oscillospiraceae bacterium]